MKQDQTVLPYRRVTAALLVVTFVGCTSLKQAGDSVVRVNATRNPAKAARLTLAGIKAFHIGAPDEALQKFTAAIAVDETYGPAYNNLGLLYYEQNNLYDAILAFESAMDYLPTDPTVYYNLGLALEAAGKTHEAMDLYLQAVEMDPANPIFLGNLVRLRVRLGENDPSLVAQLRDLVLIETRPAWRRWADGQLALHYNDSLDRGPETPDFNTQADRKQSTASEQNKTIDLTPPSSGRTEPDRDPQSRTESGRRILSGPETGRSPQAEMLPAPVRRKDLMQLQDSASTPQSNDYFQ